MLKPCQSPAKVYILLKDPVEDAPPGMGGGGGGGGGDGLIS